MYIQNYEKQVSEMERQRTGEYIPPAPDCEDRVCHICRTSAPLYNLKEDGRDICIECAEEILYKKLSDASYSFDADIRHLYELSLCFCDFAELIKEEYDEY